jgi:hypothetical protein
LTIDLQGVKFKVNKMMLAINSQYFREFISADPKMDRFAGTCVEHTYRRAKCSLSGHPGSAGLKCTCVCREMTHLSLRCSTS